MTHIFLTNIAQLCSPITSGVGPRIRLSVLYVVCLYAVGRTWLTNK